MRLPAHFDARVVFEDRASAVSARHRLSYRMAELLLLLSIGSRGGASSLFRLHVLNSILRDDTNVEDLRGWLRHPDLLLGPSIRIEPSLVRVLAYAEASGLVKIESGRRAKLTDPGKDWAARIVAEEGLFVGVRPVLQMAKKILTEGALKSALAVYP